MVLSIKNHQNKLPVVKGTVRQIAKKILSKFSISRYRICIAFLDDENIKRLNKRFLGSDFPTDVLAFPYKGSKEKSGSVLWADIAISTDTAIKNSRYFKTSVNQELCLYIIHGILHILGFDDNTASQRQRMEKEQQHWLKKLKPEIKYLLK